jgi:hypothetical protein
MPCLPLSLKRSPFIVALLFLPAALGLLARAIGYLSWHNTAPEVSVCLLSLATFLICLEQARMAAVDLQQISRLQAHAQNPSLRQFRQITLTTIVLELVGFYISILWLGWGALTVLLSQVWFNLFAGVQLQPQAALPIQPYGALKRLPVLLADSLGLLLVGLWLASIWPIEAAGLLLSLVLLYAGIKYLLPLTANYHSK